MVGSTRPTSSTRPVVRSPARSSRATAHSSAPADPRPEGRIGQRGTERRTSGAPRLRRQSRRHLSRRSDLPTRQPILELPVVRDGNIPRCRSCPRRALFLVGPPPCYLRSRTRVSAALIVSVAGDLLPASWATRTQPVTTLRAEFRTRHQQSGSSPGVGSRARRSGRSYRRRYERPPRIPGRWVLVRAFCLHRSRRWSNCSPWEDGPGGTLVIQPQHSAHRYDRRLGRS
jgi:hypothetical protein